MTVYRNFVQCSVVNGFSDSQQFMRLSFADPFNGPPDPAGGIGRLIIRDSLRDPTAFEIVTYASINEPQAGIVDIQDMQRGQEGTTARSWSAGAVVTQDLTAEDLKLLELQSPTRFIVGGSADNSVRSHDENGLTIWISFEHENIVRSVDVNSAGEVASIDLDGIIVKTDPQGNESWTYEAPETGFVAISDSGRVYYATIGSTPEAGCLDSGGSLLWSYSLTAYSTDIAVDESDNVFVCTLYTGPGSGLHMFSKDGNLAWITNPPYSPGHAPMVDIVPDKRMVVTDSGLDIVFVDYGGQAVSWFPENRTLGSISAVSNGRVLVGVESTEIYLAEMDGSQVWSESIPDPAGVIASASDVGIAAYTLPTENNLINVLDLENGSSIGVISNFGSPVRSLATPRLSPYHVVVFEGGDFKLRRLSYNNLADRPASYESLLIKQSVEPETPPTDEAVLHFNGTDLSVIWDDGTEDVIASKP